MCKTEPGRELAATLNALFNGVHRKMSMTLGAVSTGIGYHGLRRRCLGEVPLLAEEIPIICRATQDRQLLDLLEEQAGFTSGDPDHAETSELTRSVLRLVADTGRLSDVPSHALSDNKVDRMELTQVRAALVQIRDQAAGLIRDADARLKEHGRIARTG